MPRLATHDAKQVDMGRAREASAELGDDKVSHVTVRQESHGPGDAFVVPGGHTSGADAGSTFVIFSPTEEIARVESHTMQRPQALFSSPR
ncbi:MAG TPA: hypothetical protein VM388_11905 [Acidimicrobiales bacterium]|jgi:hypothetical protein|nr:hypothetical protein [Acidimicrobiales bacterium]HWI03776.1 hypothetical protein [Acidimicrobiales bacterium]